MKKKEACKEYKEQRMTVKNLWIRMKAKNKTWKNRCLVEKIDMEGI